MNHSDFSMGQEFYCGGGKWRCTDIGKRTIAAIRIDQVEVVHSDGKGNTSSEVVTDDPSWFNGPPMRSLRAFSMNMICRVAT